MPQGKWIINEVNGRVVIMSRDGTDLTKEDCDLVRLVMANHFRSEAGLAGQRGRLRPNSGDEVDTRNSRGGGTGNIRHTLDPIVNFFTAYRRKRKLPLVSIARLTGELRAGRLTSYETGQSRPFIEMLRDWGYALGFDIMPIPIGLRHEIIAVVNVFLADQYTADILAWSSNPVRSHREGVNVNADLSPGAEFLRDSDHFGPPAPGETAGGGVSDS